MTDEQLARLVFAQMFTYSWDKELNKVEDIPGGEQHGFIIWDSYTTHHWIMYKAWARRIVAKLKEQLSPVDKPGFFSITLTLGVTEVQACNWLMEKLEITDRKELHRIALLHLYDKFIQATEKKNND